MLFEDASRRLEFTLTGYQFPEIVNVRDDANWLNVQIELRTPGDTYTGRAPCLLTCEVGWLALWLENLARDVPQSGRLNNLEPYLSFEHIAPDGDRVTIRAWLSGSMAPPWAWPKTNDDGFSMDFTLTRTQLEDAGLRLRTQLRHFPPRAGVEWERPFVPPELASNFLIHWLLTVPGETEYEARTNVEAFMNWIHLRVAVRSCTLRSPGHWDMSLLTEVPVSGSEPFLALFSILGHMPMPSGLPRIGRPYLWPDGVFTCLGQLDPRQGTKCDDNFGRISGTFELTNLATEPRFLRLSR